ncbi:hypothetical protein BLNAU_21973 [Blattamonas nauphoetae]|uniref:Uncharacterized protein n=1 Tax=Blattamonas nauphoetae TaxID=2049346 RepID=A0ABQ9WYM2_9EUKA|nr:hypothetical protein BLNAU_21973 [Blattamonas nauphoetae]
MTLFQLDLHFAFEVDPHPILSVPHVVTWTVLPVSSFDFAEFDRSESEEKSSSDDNTPIRAVFEVDQQFSTLTEDSTVSTLQSTEHKSDTTSSPPIRSDTSFLPNRQKLNTIDTELPSTLDSIAPPGLSALFPQNRHDEIVEVRARELTLSQLPPSALFSSLPTPHNSSSSTLPHTHTPPPSPLSSFLPSCGRLSSSSIHEHKYSCSISSVFRKRGFPDSDLIRRLQEHLQTRPILCTKRKKCEIGRVEYVFVLDGGRHHVSVLTANELICENDVVDLLDIFRKTQFREVTSDEDRQPMKGGYRLASVEAIVERAWDGALCEGSEVLEFICFETISLLGLRRMRQKGVRKRGARLSFSANTRTVFNDERRGLIVRRRIIGLTLCGYRDDVAAGEWKEESEDDW